jgi:hypothetical protein
MRNAGKHFTRGLVCVTLLALASAGSAAAQGARQSVGGAAEAGGAAMRVSTVAGGSSFSGAGPGRCARETEASLYEKPAALYMIEYAGTEGVRGLRLTVWQFKDGSPGQLSLSLDAGSASHRISTLQGSKIEGAGQATVQSSGAGGRIVVEGKDEKGVPLKTVVECRAFAGIEAEGG